MADALSRLANAYREQGDNAKALEFAQSASRAAKEAGVLAIASYALTEAGKAQRGLGRKTEALNAFAEAIQVAAIHSPGNWTRRNRDSAKRCTTLPGRDGNPHPQSWTTQFQCTRCF